MICGRKVCCSLDDYIEELVPISRLVPAQLHCKSLNLFNQQSFDLNLLCCLCFCHCQRHLNQALLHQIIQLVAAVLSAQSLVDQFQFLYLPALVSVYLIHLWVKETADLPVVVLQRLQN